MAASDGDRTACMAVLQDWYEGGVASFQKLAVASGISVNTIKSHAARHNWKKRPTWRFKTGGPGGADVETAAVVTAEDYAALEQAGAEPEARLRRMTDFLLREVEALGIAAQRQGAAPAKARLDAVLAMIRVLEKVDGFARERAGGAQARRNEEAGDVLRRIDGRIEELARAYAKELAAGAGAPGELGGGEPQRG